MRLGNPSQCPGPVGGAPEAHDSFYLSAKKTCKTGELLGVPHGLSFHVLHREKSIRGHRLLHVLSSDQSCLTDVTDASNSGQDNRGLEDWQTPEVPGTQSPS